jgi:hypothetical protein
MKRVIILLALLALGAAQRPVDERDLPDFEKQIPPGDYCKRKDVPITKNESRAHHCDCTYSCYVDANGNVIETGGHRNSACLASCEMNGRRCTCHVEEPCPAEPGHNALADMHHTVVLVARGGACTRLR